MRIRKAVQARRCLHAAGSKQEVQSTGLNAGPAATDNRKAVWSMGLLQLSKPGQMFIQELQEAEIGPQRAAQRTHSLTFHPAAFPASSRSLSHGRPVRSANL